MTPSELDHLLDLEASRPLPPAPDLRSVVQQELTRRRNAPGWSRILPVVHWYELLGLPRLTTAALALALFAGAASSVFSVLTSGANDSQHARSSLHLNVFDPKGYVDFTLGAAD